MIDLPRLSDPFAETEPATSRLQVALCLASYWRQLRSLSQQPAVKREIDEELRLHLELREAKVLSTRATTENHIRHG